MTDDPHIEEATRLQNALAILDADDWQALLGLREALAGITATSTSVEESVATGMAAVDAFIEERIEDRPATAADLVMTSQRILRHLRGNTETGSTGPGGLRIFLADRWHVGEEIGNQVLAWEQDHQPDLANVLRTVHTLKGEASMLCLPDLEACCHRLEETVDGCTGNKRCSGILLTLADAITGYLHALHQQLDEIAPDEQSREQPAAISSDGNDAQALDTPSYEDAWSQGMSLPEAADPDTLREFVEEASEHMQGAELALLTIESDGPEPDLLNRMFRAFHTVKGLAGFLGLSREQTLMHRSEDLLDHLRSDPARITGNIRDLLFAVLHAMEECLAALGTAVESGTIAGCPSAVDVLMNLDGALAACARGAAVPDPDPPSDPTPAAQASDVFPMSDTSHEDHDALESATSPASEIFPMRGDKPIGAILVEGGAVEPEVVEGALEQQRRQRVTGIHKKLGEMLVEEGRTSAKDVEAAAKSQASGAPFVSSTMKVEVEHVDSLGNAIGELVIAQNMLGCLPELRDTGSRTVKTVMGQLLRITRTIQDTVTRLRMVPVKPVFQRMNRLVRDVSKKTGKPVAFASEGDDIEVDKSLVDKIGDPLVHLVRNSVDHGLESPHQRAAAGKPEKGQVHLRAEREAGHIVISISDDGRGLNRDGILKRAVERGIVSDGSSMSDDEVWELIFAPGFSTAEQVTDVSGRGVGMDVVKRTVEELRGSVRIQTEEGVGTRVSLIFPLTLAIIDGMLVTVDAVTYIIPTLSMTTSLCLKDQHVSTMAGRHRMLDWQGHQIPLFSLRELFGYPPMAPGQRPMAAIVSDGTRTAALEVDAVLERQQVVLKAIDRSLPDVTGISGSSITGEGRVCLVLDIAAIVSMAGQRTHVAAAS